MTGSLRLLYSLNAMGRTIMVRALPYRMVNGRMGGREEEIVLEDHSFDLLLDEPFDDGKEAF